LLQSILTGFGIVIPIFALIRTSNLKTIAVKDLFILTAVQMVRLAGIAYFILWLITTWEQNNELSDAPIPFKDRLFGPYWLPLLFAPVMTLVLSQLFWIKKLYMKKAALITFALLLLILPSQRVMFFVTSLHRDYLPSSWSITTGNMFIQTALNIIVFIFITFAVMLSSGKLKKIFFTPN
jgi:hypothetical protein